MQIFNYQFKPKLIPTIATLLLLLLMVNLGMWQSNKADLKQAKRILFEQREKDGFVSLGLADIDLETMRYRRIALRGNFEPEFQILLDNKVYKGQAGYHVVTPFLISGSSKRILVNRGWVPVGADRNVLPKIETVGSQVEVTGYLQDLSGRYFELGSGQGAAEEWHVVWQNLDIERYKKLVKYEIQPGMLLLDSSSTAGGFVREWPKPDDRMEVNRGYAIQWYLMSLALIIIFIVTNLKKTTPQEISNAKH
jgi:surfeit locus 1 family protein